MECKQESRSLWYSNKQRLSPQNFLTTNMLLLLHQLIRLAFISLLNSLGLLLPQGFQFLQDFSLIDNYTGSSHGLFLVKYISLSNSYLSEDFCNFFNDVILIPHLCFIFLFVPNHILIYLAIDLIILPIFHLLFSTSVNTSYVTMPINLSDI